MYRRCIFWISALTLFAPAQLRAEPADSARVFSLNGAWKFSLARNEGEAERLARFYEEGFDIRTFKESPVPSNWAVLGYEEPIYRGFTDDRASEGFYLRDFTPPDAMSGKRVLLHFGGVWASADVWLNGKPLGRHDSGYTSFAFDVTDGLRAGVVNRLAVRVRQVSRDYKFDVYDDWTLGGIYRDVSLEAMPKKLWLDRVIVQTDFDDLYEDADLNLRVMVGDNHKNTLPGNYPSPGEPYQLRFTLLEHEGAEISRRELTVPAHISTDREVRLRMRIARPNHWTAETPYLYDLRVELVEKGSVVHVRSERVGFREISTMGGVFRINGQAVKLRGVNRHDEHPDVGRATTREHWLQDITLMKAANINYVRLSHYPPARGFVELCDEMGLYLGNEVPLGGAGRLMYNPSFSGAVLQRSYETVMRDINSPSIVYWSIGNEDPLTSLHMASVHTVKGLDPTRPVLLPWRAEEWLPPEVDILAPHYWKPQEYDELAGKSSRPIITTEYTHAYGTRGLGGLEARWKALTRHPAGTGGAVWMWADQALKTPMPKTKAGGDIDKDLWLTANGWDGIVDAYRGPTRDYWEVKSVYAQVYPAVSEVSFVPGQAAVRVPIQNDYDFTDLEAVQIAWSLHEDDREIAQGFGKIKGKPHAVTSFELPLAALKTTSTAHSYYAWFVFVDKHGKEINRKAVELIPPQAQPASSRAFEKLTLTKTDSTTIQAGDVKFVFDSKSGNLGSASLNGKTLITGLRPTIWRSLDTSEQIVVGRADGHGAVDLNHYEASISAWDIDEDAERVAIHAKVNYSIDEKNKFTVDYDYSVGRDGRLRIRYAILTHVSVPCVPIVGMSLDSAPELRSVRWFGLGPGDAYPNKRSAPILGVWDTVSTDEAGAGTKAMRWVERADSSGGFRIENDGYLEIDPSNPLNMRILSGVLGRPEKGRKADESVPQLETNTDQPFVGEFIISLK